LETLGELEAEKEPEAEKDPEVENGTLTWRMKVGVPGAGLMASSEPCFLAASMRLPWGEGEGEAGGWDPAETAPKADLRGEAEERREGEEMPDCWVRSWMSLWSLL